MNSNRKNSLPEDKNHQNLIVPAIPVDNEQSGEQDPNCLLNKSVQDTAAIDCSKQMINSRFLASGMTHSR
jgi:hypothetical protein